MLTILFIKSITRNKITCLNFQDMTSIHMLLINSGYSRASILLGEKIIYVSLYDHIMTTITEINLPLWSKLHSICFVFNDCVNFQVCHTYHVSCCTMK